MGRRKLSVQETRILGEIVRRAVDLPLPLIEYSREIGRIREELISRNPGNGKTANRPRGYVDGHNIHASPRYGQTF